jgi:peptidoglycan glycosyltransferase
MRLAPRTTLKVALGVALVGAAVGFLSGPGAADETDPSAPAARRPRGRTFPGLDPRRHRVEDGAAVADLTDGSTAVLSIDPGLQAHVAAIYQRYEVPYGALVAMDPRTGRVLAYVSHSSAEPQSPTDHALDPGPPAASIFKIVTGSALIDAGVDPNAMVCYHGGLHGIAAHHLDDDPARDRDCATLIDAMGGSINGVFAKLAVRHLDAQRLERYASAFGFGHTLPFDVPTRISAVDIPTERLELARTAAGFWHSHMSPLHGALIASTIANDGRMPRATIVDQVLDPAGRISYRANAEMFRNVVSASTAREINRTMRATVSSGTARRAFFDERGNPFLPGIEVAGKTGTLSSERPYRGYTWFVGFAPADDPQIAVAALVVNEPAWRIKASFAAREALRYWLVSRRSASP